MPSDDADDPQWIDIFAAIKHPDCRCEWVQEPEDMGALWKMVHRSADCPVVIHADGPP